MAPGPLPDASALNTPGALETTAKVRELDRTLPKIDSTEALEAPATSYGTIALICPAPAYSIGAGHFIRDDRVDLPGAGVQYRCGVAIERYLYSGEGGFDESLFVDGGPHARDRPERVTEYGYDLARRNAALQVTGRAYHGVDNRQRSDHRKSDINVQLLNSGTAAQNDRAVIRTGSQVGGIHRYRKGGGRSRGALCDR